jgi:hypothetical protein
MPDLAGLEGAEPSEFAAFLSIATEREVQNQVQQSVQRIISTLSMGQARASLGLISRLSRQSFEFACTALLMDRIRLCTAALYLDVDPP